MTVVAHAAAVATPLIINTPIAATQCIPIDFTWTGGVGESTDIQPLPESTTHARNPQRLSLCILEGGNVVQSFRGIPGETFKWAANVTGGVSVDVQLKDSAGAAAFTAPFEILASSNTGCL
ncbi:hypothetical protein K466DRAFT_600049 [Polyporus arcularius HHB13444]|uniref:Lytic polysaccharide monooxygenase n=1 Tax=Polyporus arcularius HHB13444 TaxID=1314778 RepID=A0A5C3PAT4_9APHY|nr:hypothetical protein K466DRAFT_600049 [Polyporus arcularius HHB13444]